MFSAVNSSRAPDVSLLPTQTGVPGVPGGRDYLRPVGKVGRLLAWGKVYMRDVRPNPQKPEEPGKPPISTRAVEISKE